MTPATTNNCRAIIVFLALLSFLHAKAEDAEAEPEFTPEWYVQGGTFIHYSEDDPDYGGSRLFVGVEYFRSRKWSLGFSMFDNSFGQFSQYAYVGRVFHPLKSQPYLHIKITAGVIHGYDEPHHDTLPIRWGDSWGIGAIPTIGYKKDRLGFDLAFLKASGVLFLAGYSFD